MSAWTTVLTAVTAQSGMTQKCPVLVAGIKSAVKAQYAARSDQDMTPLGLKALDTVLDEVAASNAATLAALIA